VSAGRAGCSGRGSWRPAGGLVVPGGVDDKLAQELAGGGVDDPDVQVLDEHQDAGPGVGPADADVMQAAADAEGELAVGVDAVGADPVAGAGGSVAGTCFGPGGVSGGGSGLVRQGAVRALGVVDAGEGVKECLRLAGSDRLPGLGAEPFLECLLEPLDFPLGLGAARLAVLLLDAQAAQLGFQVVAAACAARVVKTMPLSVKVEAGAP
jgi:hypothetical protein